MDMYSYVAQLAKAIRWSIAARPDYCGDIGQDARVCLIVYTAQKLMGVTYMDMVQTEQEQAFKWVKSFEDLIMYGVLRPPVLL